MSIETCSIVGSGMAARAMAPALRAAGIRVLSVTGRNLTSASRLAEKVAAEAGALNMTNLSADLVLLAVTDSSIEAVLTTLGPENVRSQTIVAHMAGALRPDILAPVPTRAKLHPLASLAGGPERLPGIVWGIEGTAPVMEELRDLVGRLQGIAIDTSSTDLGLYHLAAVFGSNFLLGTIFEATKLWEDSGAPLPASEALIPLARTVIDNWSELGLPAALTGPVKRGDGASIAAQLRTMAQRGREAEQLYRTAALAVFALAQEDPDAARLADVGRLLKESEVLD